MKTASMCNLPGALVTLPLARGAGALHGFWAHGARRGASLLVFVHGMGGNFYRSAFKRRFMLEGPRAGVDVLSFHNRGHTVEVADERFADCLADLDAALAFAAEAGYASVVLLGHSTGCQKSVHYLARRAAPRVRALVLAAPGDDVAIARRDLGRRYGWWIARAKRLVAAGRGAERLPRCCQGFSARRFLSACAPASVEGAIFDYAGALRAFRRVRVPTLVYFGAAEEYACLPVAEMGARLRRHTRAERFDFAVFPGADHGFTGCEARAVRYTLRWLRGQGLGARA